MKTMTHAEWYLQFLRNLERLQAAKTGPLETKDYLNAAKGTN